MAGLGKTRGASTYGKKPKYPSAAEQAEHQGRTPMPGVPAGARDTQQPSASGFEYSPQTYEKTGLTPPAQTPASEQRQTEHAEQRRVERAEARQARIVNKYVTKAYEPKSPGLFSIPSLGSHVEQAKSNVAKARENLLSHPTVEKANAEGKVLGPKGLSKLKEPSPFKLPGGFKRSPGGGTEAAGLVQTPAQKRHLEATAGERKGRVGKAVAEGEGIIHARSEPSTLEALGYASIGIPGLGIGSDVAKLGELGAETIPKLFAEGGAKQAAKDLGAGIGAKAAAKAATVRAAPKAAAEAVGRIPGFFTTDALKAGARAFPDAASTAAKGAPKALGRGALSGAGNTYQAGSGLAAIAGTQKLGIHTAPGEIASGILKGGEQALLHHPVETAETTLRALPAAITGPAALAYGVGEVPFEGTKPLTETAKGQWEGIKQIGGNLLSGNPKLAQQAIQKEGALTFLTPIPALSKTKLWGVPRDAARDVAASARRTTGKGRVAPPDASQPVFGFAQRHETRKRVQLEHSRTSNPHRVAEAKHTNAVLHGSLTRPSLSSAPEGSHVALQTLLEYGIRSPGGVKLVRERGPKSEPHVEGKVNLDAALRYAEDHPEIFKDKAFGRALKAGERASKTTPAAMLEMGEVARHRAQGDLFGITPPDKMIPERAKEFTRATDREGAWKDAAKGESAAKRLRKEASDKRAQAKVTEGERAQKLRAEAKGLSRKAKAEETRVKSLKKALDKYTRPDQKTLSGGRNAWDEHMAKEYVREVQKAQKESPLVEPTWTHHATFRSPKLGFERGALPGKAGGKVYVRSGKLAENDLVDRSLEAFIRGTVQMPRRRAAATEFTRSFVRNEKHPYMLDGKAQDIVPDAETWAKITGPKSKDNPNGGQYDPASWARFPVREWKSAVEHPFTTEGDLNGLLEDAMAARIPPHEPSIIVPRESIREFQAIANPDRSPVTQFLNQLSRTSSRLILGTNPAWLVAQIPAEGIPLLLAHPELINPLKTGSIAKDLRAYAQAHPEEAAVLQGAAGASPSITAGTLRSPLDLERDNSFNPQPAMFANAAKQMTRGRFGRAMISTAKLEPLGLFDVKRQNAYRSVLLAAEADKRFRSFESSVRGMFRKSSDLSGKFRGKSREEMWNWLSTTKEGKRELGKLADYVDNIQGNWTSFTRYERAFAPLAIFYPFLRYSLRWTLWTFPRTHPVTATIAYMLGQANSNELEKVLGGKPDSPIQWAYPVVKNAKGKSEILPGGSRISPGQSVIQQAVAGESLGALAGGLNPFVGAAVTAIGGPGPFGTKPTNPAGWAAVDQLLAMPAPLRLLHIHSEDVAAQLGITRPQPQSVISKAFEKLDPNKGARQALAPWLPQPAQNAKMSNQLSRALGEASANSTDKQKEVARDDSLTVQARQKRIAQMKARSEKASATIENVLKKLGLNKEDQAAFERYKASLYEGESKAGIYGSKSIYGSGKSIYEGSSIYEGGNSKALNYKPPGASLSIPNLNLGGIVGAVTSPLSSLIGGTPAQAAIKAPAGKPQPDKAPKHAEATVSIQGPLTQSQKAFGKELVKLTGLDPKTVGGWMLAEDSGSAATSKEASGDANWLNIGPAYNLGSNPKQAAQYTANLINTGSFYGGIRSSVGKGVGAQVAAIQASPWDGAHYPNGIPTNLVSGKGGDVVQGRNKNVYVRADAKGMVQWAKANLGTQEGSAKQLKWASREGLGSSEPWCANFVSNGLARRGVTPPANPNATESYEIWGREGKYASVVPGLSKAKPGDVLAFSGEHTALYVGNGEMISGNFSNEVERTPVSAHANLSMIIRPKYKGGKVRMKAGVPLPGTIPAGTFSTPSGAPTQTAISAYSTTTGASEKEVKQEMKSGKLSPSNLLEQVERIYAGHLPSGAIPGFNTRKEPDLAAIGRSVEESRRKLLAA